MLHAQLAMVIRHGLEKQEMEDEASGALVAAHWQQRAALMAPGALGPLSPALTANAVLARGLLA